MIKKGNNSYLWIFCCFLLVCTQITYAGPPFLTDDPEPVDYKHWEVYLFSNLDKNKFIDAEPDLNAPAIEVNYGALPNLQLHVVVPYAWSLPSAAPVANGIGDIEAGFKYRFIQETKCLPQIAIFPVIELPIGDVNRNLGNGKTWFKLPIWAQKKWGKWQTYGGVGYAINHAQNMRNYTYAGWQLQKEINDKITLGAEIFTQGAISNSSHSFTVINAGGFYNFTKNFSFLFTAGNTVLGEQNWVAYLGLYWTGP